jgi:hypothetical protein
MGHARAAPHLASGASLAAGLGAVLLPKCPLCFAAYGSGFTALGLGPVGQQRLAGPLLATAALASFVLVLVLSLRRRDRATPLASAAGAGLLLGGVFAVHSPGLVAAGSLLLIGAALVNSVLCRRAHFGTSRTGTRGDPTLAS